MNFTAGDFRLDANGELREQWAGKEDEYSRLLVLSANGGWRIATELSDDENYLEAIRTALISTRKNVREELYANVTIIETDKYRLHALATERHRLVQ